MRDQLQATLGDAYTLERELGGGGMSRVFVARENRFGRRVVIKVLAPELAAVLSAERFEREIRLAASLQQANIVPVLTAGDTHGLPYFTMPYVEGQSLRARLVTDGALSITETTSVLRDVARALAYAHARGVVHRDIKPDNVLLSGGTAVVTDFGIAKAISAARTGPVAATLTQVGTSIGTPAYMAPEQAAGDPEVDHRADLYAFGCLAYELLAGQPPFHARTPQRVLAAHLSETPEPVAKLRADTPPALADLVMACLAKDPSQRPQSAAEIGRVLDTVTSGGGLPAMPPILIGGAGLVRRALAMYVGAFIVVAVLAKAAIVAVGLPEWVFPGALIVMALGLPMILFTAYAHHVTRRQLMSTPQRTPGGGGRGPGTFATFAAAASPHLSWKRMMLGGAWTLVAFLLLITGYMTLRALGVGPAGSLLASGKLGANERLLVAEFGVKGSVDSSLGAVVSEAVRTDLGDSRAVTVISASTIRAALGRMKRPPDSRLTTALARELAQREAIKAVVAGDITPLGAGYIVTARLVTAETGDELASFRATADSPKDLIPTVEKLSRDLRGKIGESLRSVNGSPPLEQVTTASLDALRKYQAGLRAVDYEANFEKGIALLKEAVAIDSTFAMAWRKLAVAYNNASMSRDLANHAVTQAFINRARLSEQERNSTVGYYYGSGPGLDRAKAVQAYEANLQAGFNDVPSMLNLGNLYLERREYARAESLYIRANAVGGSRTSYTMLVVSRVFLGNRRGVDSAMTELAGRYPPSFNEAIDVMRIRQSRGQVDSAQAAIEPLRASTNPSARSVATHYLGQFAVLHGRLGEATRLYTENAEADVARGTPRDPVQDSSIMAGFESRYRERPAAAVRMLDAALARFPLRTRPAVDQRPYFSLAVAYARAGRPDKAHAVIAQFDGDVKDTALRRAGEPQRHAALAEIALAEKRPLDAVREFRRGDVLPDGPVSAHAIELYANLGRAFDQANQLDSAAMYFEKYVNTPDPGRMDDNLDPTYLTGVHKRLGELYEARLDRQKAASHFRTFVELWNNADPDLQPKVADVRQRFNRLRDVEKK